MNNILIQSDNKIVIGFINSNNELEYTIYKPTDGGILSDEHDWFSEDSIAAILATEADITEYTDYTLKEIK